VVLEDLVKSPEAPARAFVLHARILAGIGEIQQAVEQYKVGVAKDRSAADPDFATRLGIGVAPEPEPEATVPTFTPSAEQNEVSDGRIRESWQGSSEEAPAEARAH
jgi:hypothetical protein